MSRAHSMGCLVLFFAIALSGCGGGGGSGGGGAVLAAPAASTVAVSGQVAAPGGQLALAPSDWRAKVAALFSVGAAHAATNPGVMPVGAGVTVNLIQIDNSGAQVGSAIASAVTDVNGNYTLQAPAGFTPGANFVVQAQGSGGAAMEAFVMSTAVNVDPYTTATCVLITGAIAPGASISAVSAAGANAVLNLVLSDASSVPSGQTSTQLASALENAVAVDPTQANVVASVGLSGSASAATLSGQVTDSTGAAIQNIDIVVQDFATGLNRAQASTDATGHYSVIMPAGPYIVAAMNRTTTSQAATQWWNGTAGGTPSRHNAGKLDVPSPGLTLDFTLAPGGRLTGTVTAGAGGAGLDGIRIGAQLFGSGGAAASTFTAPDGTYTFNVAPGNYILVARNSTILPYASQIYGSSSAPAANLPLAGKIAVTAGGSVTANFALAAGNLLSGTLTDPTGGQVTSQSVRFSETTTFAAVVGGILTDLTGNYGVWLNPGAYSVSTHGQSATVDLSAGDFVQNFSAPVGQVTGTLVDQSGNPVGRTGLFVDSGTGTFVDAETTLGDGTFTLYGTTASTSDVLGITIPSGSSQSIGSTIYLGAPNFGAATPVTMPPADSAATALGSIALPAGAVLEGVITSGGVPMGNLAVQIRNGGVSTTQRLATVRTASDGSYSVSVPANTTYSRVCASVTTTTCPDTGAGSGSVARSYAFQDNVAVGAPGTTTMLNLAF